MTRFPLVRALAGLLLLVAAPALAEQYPNRPVRMLVGYPAGGGVDSVARIVAGKLGDSLGQQFLVDNRPGAGAMLATDAAAKAPPDGYTLYVAETAILIAPSIYAKVGYDPVRSFAPVSGVCSLPLVFVAHPSVAAANARELVALLKASPGKYSYGSPGIGTVHHLAFELFKKQAGVDVVHVPYKGAAQIVPDLISNQIPLAILSAPPTLAQAKAGKLKPIAVSTPAKLASAPDWPALAETLPGFDAAPRIFILAPAGAAADVVNRLNGALKAALAQPDVLESFNAQGAAATWSTPEALGAEIAAEVRKWGAIAKESGARQE